MQPTHRSPTDLQVSDPLGVPGAPQETWGAVQAHLEGAARAGGRLILVTDRQGDRLNAAYAALIVQNGQAVIAAPAFGPRYGRPGAEALAELVRWAQERNWPVRETVLNSSDFVRVLAEPDAEEIGRLIAASNPSDPGIYTTLPKLKPVDEDGWEDD
jgi:hypothetical protein